MNEDEIFLIESTRSKKAYRNTLVLMYAIFIGSAFFFAFFFSLLSRWENVFGLCFGMWFLFVSMPCGLIYHYILKKTFNRVSIVVTNCKIICNYGYKASVNIPIDSISSITMNSSFLSAIGFTCAGNSFKMFYIENRKEIIEVINELIVENTMDRKQVVAPITKDQTTNNVDIATELKKYKKLLDDGLITQEEFETKKKKLLDL